jgi:hypothetical protein
MKLNLFETHDRLKYLVKDQSANIFQGAEECLKKNSLSLAIQDKSSYVYIFAHPRTSEDGLKKRLLWQPRLSIPEVQENSYLFRALSHTDIIEICWMIPARELWKQYQKGNVTEDNLALWSINQYKSNKKILEKPHPQDMTEEKSRIIMKQIVDDHLSAIRNAKMMNRIYEVD